MVMNRILMIIAATLVSIIASGQHTNVLILDSGHPNEPSIMLDPKNPANMIAGANTDKYFLSADTGKTWTSGKLVSDQGVWGDPCIVVDTNSNFYFFHLSNNTSGSWIDRIVCQKTTDNGLTWNSGTYMGLNGGREQDKEWAIIDRNNNNIYVTWTQFDNYGSANPADSSTILFSKSVDGGDTWSAAKRINETAGDCIDKDNTVEGAVPAVGPNGELYVAWVGPDGIVFDRSLDQGDTWLNQDIKVTDVPGGWDYEIPGISRCNGLPVTVCDLSNGPNHGTIYINWTDQRNGVDDTDVWLVKSTDGGSTWTSPKKVNTDDSGRHQFLTWMAVDQTNGNLFFVYYDRRDYSDNTTDVYIATSLDGGNTFSDQRLNETSFVPSSNVFFGDYTNIVAHNGIVRPVWTQMFMGNMEMYTALVNTPVLVGTEESLQAEFDSPVLEQNFPNPVVNETYLSYKLYESTEVTIKIYDITGKLIGEVLSNQQQAYGKHVIRLSKSSFGLTQGIYFYELSTPKNILRKKMMVLD